MNNSNQWSGLLSKSMDYMLQEEENYFLKEDKNNKPKEVDCKITNIKKEKLDRDCFPES